MILFDYCLVHAISYKNMQLMFYMPEQRPVEKREIEGELCNASCVNGELSAMTWSLLFLIEPSLNPELECTKRTEGRVKCAS